MFRLFYRLLRVGALKGRTTAFSVRFRRYGVIVLTALVVGLSTGCATTTTAPAHDPYENFNRKMFAFNEFLDRWVLKPVSESYRFVTPSFVDKGVSNFFDNLGDVGSTVNAALQGDFKQSGVSFGRFVVNSTLGLAGFIDVASKTDLPERQEDFGQTLASWGVDSGPYIVLPFFGSSTMRDAPALLVDFALNPVSYVDDDTTRLALGALNIVDTRADLLDAESLITGDRYTFIRELYLQNRASKIANGDLGDVFADDELDEDF